jgi:hypothetical protein
MTMASEREWLRPADGKSLQEEGAKTESPCPHKSVASVFFGYKKSRLMIEKRRKAA